MQHIYADTFMMHMITPFSVYSKSYSSVYIVVYSSPTRCTDYDYTPYTPQQLMSSVCTEVWSEVEGMHGLLPESRMQSVNSLCIPYDAEVETPLYRAP